MAWTALAILTASGILLIALSVRGRRIDDHPICRRCRFDLVGLRRNGGAGSHPARTARCPECGGDLSRPRATRTGNRKRSAGLALLGALLLAASLVPGGFIAAGAAGANWNPYKPEWWLVTDARSGDVAVADQAMAELAERLRMGNIGRERAAGVIELALAHQANPTAVWSDAWGQYLEVARRAEMLSPEQLQRYIRASVNISVEAMSHPVQGSPWMLEIRLHTRMAPRSPWMISIWTNIAAVNGDPVEDRSENVVAVSGGGTSVIVVSHGHPGLLALQPGGHTATVRARIVVDDAPSRSEEALHTWQDDFLIQATVASARERPTMPRIELAPDESLREQMEQAIQIRNLRIEGAGGDSGYSGTGSVMARQPPADAAFAVYWRYADPDLPDAVREARLGQISFRQGHRSGGMFGRRLPDDFVRMLPPSVDVILRPSVEAATDPDLKRIWDGEIVIPGVAVRHNRPESEGPRP